MDYEKFQQLIKREMMSRDIWKDTYTFQVNKNIRGQSKSIFILDEPTTGLHSEDIKKLLKILNRIVDNGDTVIVIEHNLDVIKVADYIIDLGPEGGNLGGEVIATGTPEQVAQNPNSYTGIFLKKMLDN